MVYQEKFKTFMVCNGIKQSMTSTYPPSSNGLAEQTVQIVKQALSYARGKEETIQDSLSKFLFISRITPHTTTGVPRAELFMG